MEMKCFSSRDDLEGFIDSVIGDLPGEAEAAARGAKLVICDSEEIARDKLARQLAAAK